MSTLSPLFSASFRRYTEMRFGTVLFVGCLALAGVLTFLYILQPAALQVVNLRLMDMVLKAAPLEPRNSRVTIVEIDDSSLNLYGQWPWPRYRLAEMLEKINSAEPAAVGLNILFPERDRTSPLVWQQTLQRWHGYTIDTSGIPKEHMDYDMFLARVLRDGPSVLGYKFIFAGNGSDRQHCRLEPVPLTRSADEPAAPALHLYQAEDIVCNYDTLAASVDRSGFLNGAPDLDGILRRLPLLISWQSKTYPSFALAVSMEYLGGKRLALSSDPLHTPMLSLEGRSFLMDEQGRYILGPLNLESRISVSARAILQNQVDKEKLKDRIVLVGLTASGLSQTFPTFFSPAATLLEIHRHSIETLLNESTVARPVFFRYVEAAVSLLLVSLLIVALIRMTPAWSLLLGAGGIFLCWLVCIWIYSATSYLFSPLLPSLSLLATCFLGLIMRFHHYQTEARGEAKEALDQLKSSRHSLQSILHTIPDIVFRLDPHARIIYISQAVESYSRDSEKLLGRSIFDLVAPEDRRRLKNRLDERRTNSRSTRDLEVTLDFSGVSEDGSGERRFFSLSSRGIYEDDRIRKSAFLGTQGILKDITEKKQLERELLQAQKMEVVGNLAAGIAHDLNNILSGLVSYPDLLLQEVGRDSPLYDKIAIIQKSGKRAATIVQDLLTLARRNVDKSEICNLNTIIRDYIDSLEFRQSSSEYDNISLELDLAEDLLNIRGSAIHLSKVVMNILHNSFEAMEFAGTILIKTENVYVDAPILGYETIRQGEYVCLTIADEGMGISREDLARVFEPFYTKKKLGRSGTGLGMSVIWATVKDHEGYIDINSREGEGTTLRLYLPSTREVLQRQEADKALEQQGGRETILVVDDIPEQRDIAQSMLRSVGYEVETAANGEEALALMQETRVDLLVLDMIMPGGWDGLETYRRVKAAFPWVKAVITSGYSESERVYEIQRLGGGEYVQKPFSMHALLQAVRNELDR